MVHKKLSWTMKRGDIFPLFTRDSKYVFTMDDKPVFIELAPKGRFILLNDLPKIGRASGKGKWFSKGKKV
jgi:hypothetical protein